MAKASLTLMRLALWSMPLMAALIFIADAIESSDEVAMRHMLVVPAVAMMLAGSYRASAECARLLGDPMPGWGHMFRSLGTGLLLLLFTASTTLLVILPSRMDQYRAALVLSTLRDFTYHSTTWTNGDRNSLFASWADVDHGGKACAETDLGPFTPEKLRGNLRDDAFLFLRNASNQKYIKNISYDSCYRVSFLLTSPSQGFCRQIMKHLPSQRLRLQIGTTNDKLQDVPFTPESCLSGKSVINVSFGGRS